MEARGVTRHERVVIRHQDPLPPAWGDPCQRVITTWQGAEMRCEHPRIVHRGKDHDGTCADLQCAVDLFRGWSTTSRCAGYVPMLTIDEPAIEEPA